MSSFKSPLLIKKFFLFILVDFVELKIIKFTGNGHNNPQTALSGEELAERCLRYFQLGANRVAGERVDTHIDALAEKTHLLVASDAGEATPVSSSTSNNGIIGTKHSIGTLQDANELDEKVRIWI